MRHFTPNDLQQRCAQVAPSPMLLDVREPWEFDICRIEGSRLVPMRQVPNVQHDLDKDAEIVVICHHGIRSRQVCMYLEHMGFSNVINLEGGIEAWTNDVNPNLKRY